MANVKVLCSNSCFNRFFIRQFSAAKTLYCDKKCDQGKDKLTHLDEEGKAKMVDVSGKTITHRTAKAKGSIVLGAKAFQLVQEQQIKKGDVLTVSQLAGIMAAKKTSELIPLCHPLQLSKVKVNLMLNTETQSVDIECEAKCSGQTGVEMEALTGVSIAALTVYDMCKAVTHDMVIKDIGLVLKTGGKEDFKK